MELDTFVFYKTTQHLFTVKKKKKTSLLYVRKTIIDFV